MIEMLPSSPQPAALPPKEKATFTPMEEKPDGSNGSIPEHAPSGLPVPGTGRVVVARERWNKPRINTWRLAATFFAFINFGMNDASYGALVPYVCHWPLIRGSR